MAIVVALVTASACQSPSLDSSATESGAASTLSSSPARSADELTRRTIERRAVEAVIWGMPAVNFDLMYQATVQSKASYNQIVYWSRFLTSKNQTLTPNPSTIYFHPFYNTKDVGPMVLEIPPAEGDSSITGSVDTAWQTAIEDVGPAGVDKGKGGKYLILPPGHKDPVPAGYIPLPSETYTGYAILRSNVTSGSDEDVAQAVAYGKRVRFYPLSQAARPPDTVFVDAIDVLYDSTIPYDIRFFESLHRFVQREPWLPRDRAMIDTLKSVGIEKGKPFAPEANGKTALENAAREAHAWLDMKYEAVFTPPYFRGTHWALPASPAAVEGISTAFANPDSYPVEDRGVIYSFAYFSARHLGTGQFYLMTIKDKDGQPLNGGSSYRLQIPPNAPVSLYWSATVYDRSTHALIRDSKWSSRGSNTPDLQTNADGSVDVYFGPTAPSGKDSNWVPTNAQGQFEVLFRFYGPEKPLFEKTWTMPDLEKVTP